MQLSTLLLRISDSEYTLLNPHQQAVHQIVYDSRKVQAQDLYVAVQGTQVDGHDFIPQAIAQGAHTIVCEHLPASAEDLAKQYPDVAWIHTAHTPRLLAHLSAAFYGYPAEAMQMIGITGTNGKTTIAWLVSRLLNALKSPTAWIGTLGAAFGDHQYPGQYTTPFPPELQALLHTLQEDGAQQVVMECSSHALVQERLGSIPFTVAAFSNLTQDHLDYHKTLENYGEAKGLLFSERLLDSGHAILNADDPWHARYRDISRGQVLTYSCTQEADFLAQNIEEHPEGTHFTLHTTQGDYTVNSPLSGRFNVYNLLAAMAIVHQLGYPLEQILPRVQQLTSVPGRLERVSPDGHPFGVYVDYAHTPDSLDNVLKTLRQFTTHQLHVVVGCGGNRDRGKRPLMAGIAEALADQVILTSDNPRNEDPLAILADMQTGLTGPDSCTILVDRAQAIHQAIAQAQPGDQILIAGKGHEDYQIIGDQRLDFDDRKVAREALHAHASQSSTPVSTASTVTKGITHARLSS